VRPGAPAVRVTFRIRPSIGHNARWHEARRAPQVRTGSAFTFGTRCALSRSVSLSPGGITMERRIALVLATLLGSFSLLWVINFKVVPIDQALTLLR
jgi:hypothetical protein